jgi:hypothetical protein
MSGLGSFAFFASSLVVWSAPWQSVQPTPRVAWREAFQSATMFGDVP